MSRGSSVRGGLCPGEGICLEGDPLSHVNRMTDASKNITLPETLFAGGNKAKTVATSQTDITLISKVGR